MSPITRSQATGDDDPNLQQEEEEEEDQEQAGPADTDDEVWQAAQEQPSTTAPEGEPAGPSSSVAPVDSVGPVGKATPAQPKSPAAPVTPITQAPVDSVVTTTVKVPTSFIMAPPTSSDHQWKMPEDQKLKEGSAHFYGWQKQATIFLTSTGLFSIVNGTEKRPAGNAPADEVANWETRDNRAKAQLSSYISLGLLSQVDIVSAYTMWTSIEQRFHMSGAAAMAIAHKALLNKQIGPTEKMLTHIQELRALRTEYYNAGGRLDDVDWKVIIMGSLRHKWEPYRPSLLTLENPDHIINLLLLEARTLDANISSGTESARAAPVKDRRSGPGCTHCGRRGHPASRCWAPGGAQAANAPSWYTPPPSMVKNEAAKVTTTPTASTAPPPPPKDASAKETARASFRDADRGHHGRALLDSGTTSHMTREKSILRDYVPFAVPIEVGLASYGGVMTALGRGSITLKFILEGVSHQYVLSDALYVPELDTDLVSLTKLEDDGVSLHFRNRRCYLVKHGQEFGYAERIDRLYWFKATSMIQEVANIVNADQDITQSLDIWHRRLGHASEGRIRSMARYGTVNGMVLKGPDPTGRCEACIFGKLTFKVSPQRNDRAEQVFEILHSDIIFMPDSSFGGAKYGLSFIDEHSGYAWFYAIRDKSSDTVVNKFKETVALIETQHTGSVKGLHSDNGGEYVNSAMQSFLEERGMVHYTIAPHRHEMNGMAERFNRSLADGIRSMLAESKLPSSYWAEAAYYWVYCRNRLSLAFLQDDQSPYQLVFGKKPDIAHLRIFGCTAYVRIPDVNRSKLEPKSEKGVFVGVYDDAAYRIYGLDGTIIKSKDVVFEEVPGKRLGNISESTIASSPPASEHTDSSDSRPTTPEPRRSSRIPKPSARLLAHQEYVRNEFAGSTQPRKFVAGIQVPRNYHEAMASDQASEWGAAAAYEFGKFMEHKVWVEVPRPPNAHIIGGQWVPTIKEKADGSIDYRMRWVARGDTQRPDEYGELFAPSGEFSVARILTALSVVTGGTLTIMDISSAYLHSQLRLDKPIYMHFPTGFSPSIPGGVCMLQKTIYGLKQGARDWSEEIRETMIAIGFDPLASSPTTYRRVGPDGETNVGRHVDDMHALTISSNPAVSLQQRFEQDIGTKYSFTRKDLTEPVTHLGWTMHAQPDRTCIGVGNKIRRMADRYQLTDANYVATPMATDALELFNADTSQAYEDPPFPYRNAVGELMWIATHARPDIAYAAHVLARHMKAPKMIHWKAVSRVIKYLMHTADISINYYPDSSSTSNLPVGYSDSDWGRDPADRKSVSGFVFMLAGGPISWKVRRQAVVAKSTAEAEYIAVSQATCEALWLRNLFQELGRPFPGPVDIYTDNTAAEQMAHNPVRHNRTKHIDIQAHHIRDEVRKRRVEIRHISGNTNPADIFTKPLPKAAHYQCLKALGMF